MNDVIKLSGGFMFLIFITLYFTLWSQAELEGSLDHRAEYALGRASKDATNFIRSDASLSSKNRNLDGYNRASNDFNIDRDQAMDVFMDSFEKNMNPQMDVDFLKQNMVRGIAAYNGVMMMTSDDQWRPLEPYVHYYEPTDTIYYFTLGEAVTVRTGNTKRITDIDNEASPYDFMTMTELRDETIMETINKRINDMTRKLLASERSGYYVKYRLPGFDSTLRDGVYVNNDVGNVLEASGVIAVYDIVYPGLKETRRVANLAGSELSLQYE